MVKLNCAWLTRRVMLIAAVLLFASCAAMGLFGIRTPSAVARSEGWQQARQRWGGRAFTHYRMVLQAPSWCRMDLEILDERVVKVYQNNCPNPPPSVTELFNLVGWLNSQAERVECAPNGCECTEQS